MDIQPAQRDCSAIYIHIGSWTDEFGGFKHLMYIRKSICMVKFYDRMKHEITTIRKNPKMTPRSMITAVKKKESGPIGG